MVMFRPICLHWLQANLFSEATRGRGRSRSRIAEEEEEEEEAKEEEVAADIERRRLH
jgi:hypothetical protein